MIWTLFVSMALAGASSSTIQEDGSVIGTVSVKAPVELARSRVSDPLWVSTTEGGGTQIKVTGKDGACLLLESMSPSVIMNVHYTTRQCPTADGVRATLQASNTFTDYSTTWRVVPEGTGSRIEYRLTMKTKLMLPQSFITGTLRKRVQELMEKIGAALGG